MNKYRPHLAAHRPIAQRDPRPKGHYKRNPHFCPIAYAAVLEVLG